MVKLMAERRALLARAPDAARANLEDLMAHLLYALKLVGPDHVGLSGDFDGGGGVDGYDSAADLPIITERPCSRPAIPRTTSPRSGAATSCG
ncbi:membrane dipeptidase [Caulobacter segnis]